MEQNYNGDFQYRKAKVLKDLENQRKKLKEDTWHILIVVGFIWLIYFATEALFFAIIGVLALFVVLYAVLVDLPKNARKMKEIENQEQLDAIEAEIEKEKKVQAELDKKCAEIDDRAKAYKEAQHAYDHPECPMCKSHNTRRISTANRAASVALVGLASDKIGKQYECFNCKHKW